MQRAITLFLLFASSAVVLGGRIPLSKKTVSKAAFMNYKESAQNGERFKAVATNGLGAVIPLKDYMNTQYFAEV